MEASADVAVAVRPMNADDWPAVATIYAEGIASGDATFETEAPSWDAWDADHLPDHRLVALLDGEVVGWAALAPASSQCATRGVAQDSVYVADRARGRGIGTALIEALVASSEHAGIWTLECGIFPENTASIRLHERAGFRVLGVRERLGRLRGEWRDVAFLERRSPLL
jgi:L-amino acid N-acyltransferase YncA